MHRLRNVSIRSQRLRLTVSLDRQNSERDFPVNIVSIELRPQPARRYPGTVYLKRVSTFPALIGRFVYTPAD